MANKNAKNLRILSLHGGTVLDLGDMEIWDGADLALLRESMTRLVNEQKCRNLGVDMSYVKYIPSGFFGMLFDWHERGVRIRLYKPQPHVKRMLWFSRFFRAFQDGGFELCPELAHASPTPVSPVTINPEAAQQQGWSHSAVR